MDNCFIVYHTSWTTSGPKHIKFICDNILTKAILYFFGCSEVISTWPITSKLANQCTRKVLFTCVVYTKSYYYSRILIFWLTDFYQVILGCDKTTSLTSISWCNSHSVNSTHHTMIWLTQTLMSFFAVYSIWIIIKMFTHSLVMNYQVLPELIY